jgi:hypothetical protein
MAVTRSLIQVGSTDWAKSLAIFPTQRGSRKAEGELISRRPSQIDASVLDGITVFVWHPGVVLGGCGGDFSVPLGETTHTDKVGRGARLEMRDHTVDSPLDDAFHLHDARDRHVTKTQRDVLFPGNRSRGLGVPDETLDVDDQISAHSVDVTETGSESSDGDFGRLGPGLMELGTRGLHLRGELDQEVL